MKPANFPARKLLRQERAMARLLGVRMPVDMWPDIRHRAGRAFRNERGEVIGSPPVKSAYSYMGGNNLHISSRGPDAHMRNADDGAAEDVMNDSIDIQAEKFELREGATLRGCMFEIVGNGFIIEDEARKKLVFVPKIHILRDLEAILAREGWPGTTVRIFLEITFRRDIGSGRYLWQGQARIAADRVDASGSRGSGRAARTGEQER